MGNSYLDVLERIANALEQQNGIPIWEILINIIPWIGVIIPIVVLFIERGETKRPYVEVSFELVRSTMACLVIRNVGRVPAELKSMTFNDCFIQQLSPEKAEILKNKNKMNVTIFPNRYWVLSLDKNVFDVIKFENTKLEVTYTYSKIGKRKEYSDYTEIDFKEYKSFLVYLSEIDELKNMAEKYSVGIKTMSQLNGTEKTIDFPDESCFSGGKSQKVKLDAACITLPVKNRIKEFAHIKPYIKKVGFKGETIMPNLVSYIVKSRFGEYADQKIKVWRYFDRARFRNTDYFCTNQYDELINI